MKRRTLMQALVIGLVAPSFARAEKKTQIDVFKTSSCSCCVDWISHLEQNGFEVSAQRTQNRAVQVAFRRTTRHGILSHSHG